MPSVSTQRLFTRALVTIIGAGALVLGSIALPAAADDVITPTDQQVIINGAGWGHGKGMSQYGADGAAKKGLTYDQILAFYYTDTTLGSLPTNNSIRVWITSDTDGALHFRPASGQVVRDSAGHKVTLPTASKYTKWRISLKGSTSTLYYRNTSGTYVKFANKLTAKGTWWVANPKTGRVKLAMPNGSTRTYSGTLALKSNGSRAITVNYLWMEYYLRSVVPAEMPASWSPEALKSQAVAARTYAAKERQAKSSSSAYDICDTSACQVYKDVSVRYSSTDAAIAATANKVVLYNGELALTQFSSSNGGWAAGYIGVPYLSAKQDPYDPVRTWTKTISAASLQAAYPSIGTFVSIQVTGRMDVGPYAGMGRAAIVKITGTAGTMTVSGGSFKSKFGLKETLFSFTTTAVNTAAKSKK
jgi:stage II sporulation protein D